MTPPTVRASPLAPFGVRSFRFQWPADLATSWAFEMEALILGWYVLAATGSVQSLVLIAALGWVGTLFSPWFGILGDRVGVRTLLCATRAVYAVLAGVLAALTLSGTLLPWHAFVISAMAGLLRPSDMGMRNVLVGQTMPPGMLMGALGISRTTSDTARVAGALAGTGGVALAKCPVSSFANAPSSAKRTSMSPSPSQSETSRGLRGGAKGEGYELGARTAPSTKITQRPARRSRSPSPSKVLWVSFAGFLNYTLWRLNHA